MKRSARISSGGVDNHSDESPLYAATIGTTDLDRSVRFYREYIGFDLVDRARLSGAAFTSHWNVSEAARAEVAVLADRWEYGRIVLVQWNNPHAGKPIRNVVGQRCYGLINLNFYSNDIERHTAILAEAGYRPWSEPVVHDMGHTVGEPIEVMIDGPDTVILNLITLLARNPAAQVLETASYVADVFKYNRCGLTPVVTTQHCVRDADRAIAFYTRVLGMFVRTDTILKGDLMEKFMDYPKGAMTRDVYLQGKTRLGKIAVNQPLNFPCSDIVPNAVPPNFGYMAQTFIVNDLDRALARCETVGAQVFSGPVEMIIPALGPSRAAIVKNPGSGALQELIQRA